MCMPRARPRPASTCVATASASSLNAPMRLCESSSSRGAGIAAVPPLSLPGRAKCGVRGHFEGPRAWAKVDDWLQPSMAPVVGARVREVSCMNGLSVNLHLMMVPFYRPTAERYKIVMEGKAFPSDRVW